MRYPKEWNDLPKRERKKNIKKLKRENADKKTRTKKVLKIAGIVAFITVTIFGYKFFTQKSPEEVAFQKKVEEVSLEGQVEEFEIEGREHVPPGTDVEYKTNPPSSGDHFASPTGWGVYEQELPDEAVVHSLEHGGIWISYNDVSDEVISVLEEIGRDNAQSVIVSPRSDNEVRIAVTSWGKQMNMEQVDKALIQKFIDKYKNKSPEKLAR